MANTAATYVGQLEQITTEYLDRVYPLMLISPNMKDKGLSENPGKEREEPLVIDILKAAFSHEGIECESVTFHRWQIIDDDIRPRPIVTVSDLFREFRDGSYELALTNAKIALMKQEPFEIDVVNVQVAYDNGKWSEPRIYHDAEYPVAEERTTQALDARLKRAKENIRSALEWLAVIVRMAETIRRLFEGG